MRHSLNSYHKLGWCQTSSLEIPCNPRPTNFAKRAAYRGGRYHTYRIARQDAKLYYNFMAIYTLRVLVYIRLIKSLKEMAGWIKKKWTNQLQYVRTSGLCIYESSVQYSKLVLLYVGVWFLDIIFSSGPKKKKRRRVQPVLLKIASRYFPTMLLLCLSSFLHISVSTRFDLAVQKFVT